jgi:hypothetical protein
LFDAVTGVSTFYGVMTRCEGKVVSTLERLVIVVVSAAKIFVEAMFDQSNNDSDTNPITLKASMSISPGQRG